MFQDLPANSVYFESIPSFFRNI